jgi:hypothetical protein
MRVRGRGITKIKRILYNVPYFTNVWLLAELPKVEGLNYVWDDSAIWDDTLIWID